jgi:hypothetical protein
MTDTTSSADTAADPQAGSGGPSPLLNICSRTTRGVSERKPTRPWLGDEHLEDLQKVINDWLA